MSKRYLAIVRGIYGWVVDYYPEEKDAHYREMRGIIGDYETSAEAHKAVKDKLSHADNPSS